MPPADYMTGAAIESCLVWLSTIYPAFTQLIDLPERSVEGRAIRALRIRSGGGDRNGVLLVGGTHARELINPDLLAGFALKLCWAYANNTSLSFGPTTWSATDIRLIVEGLDIFVLPLMNPDGREYVLSPTGYRWWRKNRSFNADGSRGTDLNRNYDFLWQWTIGNTSSVPNYSNYKGAATFSEPETQNVRWLLETYPDITCFADVHSYSELILYPWGDDNNQTTDPTQNFLNTTWDGLRGGVGSSYGEYIPSSDQTRFINMSTRIRDAIATVRGRAYTVQQGYDLYATSGVSSDYTYGRFFRRGANRKVCAWVIETNRLGSDPNPDIASQWGFQPPYSEAINVMTEVQSGLVQMLLLCLCVVREIGKPFLSVDVIDALRRFRDEEMLQSRRGRRWAELLEVHGHELLEQLARDRVGRESAERILAAAAEVVLARERDHPALLDRALVDRMDRLAARLEKRASPELRKALTSVRSDLRRMTGRSAVQALR